MKTAKKKIANIIGWILVIFAAILLAKGKKTGFHALTPLCVSVAVLHLLPLRGSAKIFKLLIPLVLAVSGVMVLISASRIFGCTLLVMAIGYVSYALDWEMV